MPIAGKPLEISHLVEQAKGGDTAAQAELFERYRAYLGYVAEQAIGPALRRRCDAVDIVQETYAAATRGFAAFHGASEPEFSAWIVQILRGEINTALRYHNAQARDLHRERDLIQTDGSAIISWFEPVSKESSPSQLFIRGEHALKLLHALGELPEDQRAAVRMRYLEGEKMDAIATRM